MQIEQHTELSVESTSLLASTMVLLGVDELVCDNSDSDTIEDSLIYADGSSPVSDEQEEMLASLALPFFKAIEEEYAGSDYSYDSVYAYIAIEGDVLKVRASLNYEELDNTDVEIALGQVETDAQDDDELDADASICSVLRKHKIDSLTFHYSGSGDSGGTDEFEVTSKVPLSSTEKNALQDLIEQRVWDYASADFNNDGSAGQVNLEIEDDQFFLRGYHGNYTRESKSFELSYPIR